MNDAAPAAVAAASGLWAMLGPLHPAVVHFPIALLFLAAIAEALFALTGRPLFSAAARVNVAVGAAGALVAIPLGFALMAAKNLPEEMLETHESLGLAVAVAAVLAAVLSEAAHRSGRPRWRWLYRGALLASAGLVVAAGYTGGKLAWP